MHVHGCMCVKGSPWHASERAYVRVHACVKLLVLTSYILYNPFKQADSGRSD